MKINFTKMHGAGNDFIVLDETRALLGLSPEQYRFLAHRHLGIGADQILSVRPSPDEHADFAYIIHNANGYPVAQCGNGARCFARYVHEQGLSRKKHLRVFTLAGIIGLHLEDGGQVRVDMGLPRFAAQDLPFSPQGLSPQACGKWETWPISFELAGQTVTAQVGLVSMGNPHAVIPVQDLEAAPVATWGEALAGHLRFPESVNVGFMRVEGPSCIHLRVYERGVGETLSCGSGACAAVVAAQRWGQLGRKVEVKTPGGPLQVNWEGLGHAVQLSGPAVKVFEGQIELPALL